jgi:quercetin dioxygenase-like cupin family protein
LQITRIQQARQYEAPKHFGMVSLRLQGLDSSPAEFASVGLSHFLPGGGAMMDTGSAEKIYVVLAGEIAIELDDNRTERLGPLDSCRIAPGEARAIRNERNEVATILVIMPGLGSAK